MKAYFAFMDKYYPEGDKLNTVNIYGYATRGTAGAYPAAMRRRSHARKHHEAGGQPEELVGSLSLPGMVTNTSPTDYRINKQMQMMKFNGERWELFGPIIEDAGPAG